MRKPARRKLTVALAGNPNSGKTTIFNALTGARQKTANYAGVTVETKHGRLRRGEYDVHVIDLPGTYSLSAFSADEVVARDFLVDEKPDIVIDVLDATNLERNLYLCLQFRELGLPVIAALNMSDQAEKQGIRIDERALGTLLGVPMRKTVGSKGTGLDELVDLAIAVHERLAAGQSAGNTPVPNLDYGREVEAELDKLVQVIASDPSFADAVPPRWLAARLLELDSAAEERLVQHARRQDVQEAVNVSREWLARHFGEPPDLVMAGQRYAYVHGAVREAVRYDEVPRKMTVTDVIDSILLHRVIGLPIFFAVVWAIFQLTFTLGEYPMKGLEWLFQAAGSAITANFPDGWFRSLVVDGVLGGVGGMLVFLPNIMLLFLGISFLEDTGYMARTAFLMDKVMHRIGLHGQSFIPLMLGFGCSVPAIMGARTLRSRVDRVVTILIVPLMSCGARLPVYTLLAGAFFPAAVGGNVLFSVYLLGVLLAVTMALVFRKTLFRGESTPFVMELPPYRMPTARAIVRHIWDRSWLYLRKAGTVILAASVVVWFLTSYPKTDGANPAAGKSVAAPTSNIAAPSTGKGQLLEASYAGMLGKVIEPVLAPLGFDWKIGIALTTGLAAKEIVVSTLATIYSVGDEHPETLRGALRADPVFNPLVAYCLMVFILIYLPCLSTLAIIKQELGSWKWVFFQVAWTTGLAWIVTFLFYRVGRLLGLG